MQVGLTNKVDNGKSERQAQWAIDQRTRHGLKTRGGPTQFSEASYAELSEIAEQAKRRAEVAR